MEPKEKIEPFYSLDIIQNLTEKYNLAQDSYSEQNIWKKHTTPESKERYKKLKRKWQKYIGMNWYGFELERLPVKIYDIIDDFLEYIKNNNPDFEIHQVKTKFGSIRIYLGNITGEDQEKCFKLTQLLFDRNWIF